MPLAPEPFVERKGSVQSGSTLRFDIRGQMGEPLVFVMSRGIAPVPILGWDGSFWVSAPLLGATMLVGAGQGTRVLVTLELPAGLPGFAGLALAAQLFAPFVPGTTDPRLRLAANPLSILLR